MSETNEADLFKMSKNLLSIINFQTTLYDQKRFWREKVVLLVECLLFYCLAVNRETV